MKVTQPLKLILAIFVAWTVSSTVAEAFDSTDSLIAYEAVQSGIRAFQLGDFEKAATKFEEAISLSADETVVRFDQACVELAQGEKDGAREKLRQAVVGSDPEVVQSAHYNLGFLKVQQAKTKLQPDPAAVAKKVRTEVIDELEQAARYFRNTLEINPNHEDAAYNLELIRMYLKQLKTIWKQQDEQQQQPEESLTQLLLGLQESFRDAERKIVTLQDESDSTSRQTAVSDFQLELREVDKEVKKVRPLFEQWLQSAMPSGNTQNSTQPPAGPSEEEEAEAIKGLTAIVDQLEAASEKAVASIATEDWPQGQKAASENILAIHQLFLNVASYQETLQAALAKQRKLNTSSANLLDNQIKPLAEEQQFVSDFSQALMLKAEQQLPQVEQQLQQLEPAPADAQSPQQPSSSGPQPVNSQASVLQADEQKAMLEGLQESMSRAIQLAPSAVRYGDKAANQILQAESEIADKNVPERQPQPLSWAQGKVLGLLQDIAEPLQDPNSDQQQQSDGQDGEKSEDDQQQNDDQNPDDQKPNDEQSESDQGQPEEPNGDESQGTEDQQPDEKGDAEPKPLPEMAQREAEAVLRKAAEREQEYRELKKRLQKLQSGKAVKKDW